MPRRNKKEKGRGKEEPDEGKEEGKIRSEITQEVVAGIKGEVSAQDGVNPIAQRTVGQRVMRNWDCSQIENEEEKERGNKEGTRWQHSGMNSKKMEEILERRRMEGSSLQFGCLARST